MRIPFIGVVITRAKVFENLISGNNRLLEINRRSLAEIERATEDKDVLIAAKSKLSEELRAKCEEVRALRQDVGSVGQLRDEILSQQEQISRVTAAAEAEAHHLRREVGEQVAFNGQMTKERDDAWSANTLGGQTINAVKSLISKEGTLNNAERLDRLRDLMQGHGQKVNAHDYPQHPAVTELKQLKAGHTTIPAFVIRALERLGGFEFQSAGDAEEIAKECLNRIKSDDPGEMNDWARNEVNFRKAVQVNRDLRGQLKITTDTLEKIALAGSDDPEDPVLTLAHMADQTLSSLPASIYSPGS